MKKIDALLLDYAAYHSTKGNVACHFVGIPLIVFGLFSMLLPLRIVPLAGFELTAAELLLGGAVLYYATLDVRLALAMAAAAVLLDALARAIGNPWVGLVVFAVGWVFQGIGHARYEKKAPAFLKNVVHLLVGPIFLLNEALKVRPIAQAERG